MFVCAAARPRRLFRVSDRASYPSHEIMKGPCLGPVIHAEDRDDRQPE